jgi:hypothetical protein
MQLPHTVWWDNFSKIYGVKCPLIASGAYRNALWTGVAIRTYNNPTTGRPLTLDVRLSDGAVVPAMPASVFCSLGHVLELFEVSNETGQNYFDSSLVKRYNVNTVPLKPDVSATDPVLQNILNESRDGLKHFYPSHLVKHNIGSNKGLLKILRTYYEHNNMHNGLCQKYRVLNVDINIFVRIAKVCCPTTKT